MNNRVKDEFSEREGEVRELGLGVGVGEVWRVWEADVYDSEGPGPTPLGTASNNFQLLRHGLEEVHRGFR